MNKLKEIVKYGLLLSLTVFSLTYIVHIYTFGYLSSGKHSYKYIMLNPLKVLDEITEMDIRSKISIPLDKSKRFVEKAGKIVSDPITALGNSIVRSPVEKVISNIINQSDEELRTTMSLSKEAAVKLRRDAIEFSRSIKKS